MENLVVVLGASGSGKRTAMGILEDLFQFVAVTKVAPAQLTEIVSILPFRNVALSVSTSLPSSPGIDQHARNWVDASVMACRALCEVQSRLTILFLYRSQAELQRVETTFYHPLKDSCGGSLPAAVFKECEMLAQFARRLDTTPDGKTVRERLLFIDTSGLAPWQLRRILEDHFSTPVQMRRRHRATEDQTTSEFVTRGWNQMGDTLQQVARTIEIFRRHATAQQTIETDRLRTNKANPMTCLILGESGTGKELIAQRIHNETVGRNAPPLTRIDCAALATGIIEGELFGYKKGAFTNAFYDKKGLLEIARNGTIFLDEIGLMDTATQGKLLTFIENGFFRSLGDLEPKHVEGIRIIAATSRNLEDAIQEGKFLNDLYYRLAAATIRVPPLRNRREDIYPLLGVLLGRRFDDVSPEVLAILLDYHWPGNVRELTHFAEQFDARDRRRITVDDLPPGFPGDVAAYVGLTEYFDYMNFGRRDVVAALPASAISDDLYRSRLRDGVRDGALDNDVERAEAEVLRELLARNNWNVSATASALEWDRRKLHRKIRQYGIERPGASSRAR